MNYGEILGGSSACNIAILNTCWVEYIHHKVVIRFKKAPPKDPTLPTVSVYIMGLHEELIKLELKRCFPADNRALHFPTFPRLWWKLSCQFCCCTFSIKAGFYRKMCKAHTFLMDWMQFFSSFYFFRNRNEEKIGYALLTSMQPS